MTETTTTTKKPGLNSLAIVGFGALLIAGIFLAIYAARFVPETLSRLSSAVILSSDPEENEESPAATSTPSRPTTPTATTTRPTTPSTPTTPIIGYYPPVVTSTTPNLYGKADLALVDVEAGYFRGSSFVEDNEVPDGRDAGIKFTVRNIGTNAASNWRVQVDVEGDDTAIGNGGYLLPNGYQNFTLRVTDPEEGENMEIDIEVDYQNRVDESNERNNDDSVDLDIED